MLIIKFPQDLERVRDELAVTCWSQHTAFLKMYCELQQAKKDKTLTEDNFHVLQAIYFTQISNSLK